jgi:hypothetical protein
MSLTGTHPFLVVPGLQLWQENLLRVVDHLLADHDDAQLLGQFDEAATVAALKSDTIYKL